MNVVIIVLVSCMASGQTYSISARFAGSCCDMNVVSALDFMECICRFILYIDLRVLYLSCRVRRLACVVLVMSST